MKRPRRKDKVCFIGRRPNCPGKEQQMKYSKGDILIGEINGAMVEIVEITNNGHYIYKDVKTRKKFIGHYKTIDRYPLEKEN